jgi:uncharacterized 2Fe-2S/4Fe-4S cluster protein (DUF4445 family)
MMAQFTVKFLPMGRSVAAPEQTSLLEAAATAGLPLHAPCGGQGRCGKCAVRVTAGAGEPTAAETRLFSPEELAQGWRLACQTRISRDLGVEVPTSAVIVAHRIQVEGVGREVVVEPNVEKVALRLPPPSTDDARDDLSRLLDALGKKASPPQALRTLRELPALLRGSGYHVTAVMTGGVVTAVEPGDTGDGAYGVAVDIGTTTVVVYLCHLPTGRLAAVASEVNPQTQYGEDVISRLQLAVSGEEGLARLHGAVTGAIDELIGRAAGEAGISRGSIYEIVVVGNTCMGHLLLGLEPVGLVRLPFVPIFRNAQTVRAADLGIEIHPDGQVYVAPNIGGYVGADTVGVILASELDQSDGLRVAVDIGTNGEIVVAQEGELWACSTAAGPAFEGARISRGMRAATGAIDQVSVDGDVSYHVIGGVAPVGICGSGLVDAVAELVRVGVVEESGRLRRREEVGGAPEKVRRRLVENGGGLEFVVASAQESGSGRPVTITARDIREGQLAKGAIYAGIELVLESLGRRPEEIERLLLAGAFGNYIKRESAVAIGLVPALPAERIVSIGNAAGLGARLALCSVSLRRRAEEIARRVHHVELSEQDGFYDHFAEAMALRPLPRAR